MIEETFSEEPRERGEVMLEIPEGVDRVMVQLRSQGMSNLPKRIRVVEEEVWRISTEEREGLKNSELEAKDPKMEHSVELTQQASPDWIVESP